MTDFVISPTQTLTIAFRASDLLIQASMQTPSGEIVKAGTFCYGSGKMGFGEVNSNTLLQDRLFHAFAPLARGEDVPQKQNTRITNFAVAFDMVRQGDNIKIIVDTEGNIAFHLKGKDLGFTEKVNLSVPANSESLVFHALQNFLHEALKLN